MRQNLRPYQADGNLFSSNVDVSTEENLECPFCFSSIDLQLLSGIFWNSDNLQTFLKCRKCRNSFVGYAKQDGSVFRIKELSKGNHKIRDFPPEVEVISPMFVKICSEADFAEQDKLSEICGGGYRKALEFLIKDYLIKKYPEKEVEIKKKFLGNCISEMTENPKVKEIAKRATWLGNDEIHYFRKWEGKDLEDLKRLIEITQHLIALEIQSDKYIGEMENE